MTLAELIGQRTKEKELKKIPLEVRDFISATSDEKASTLETLLRNVIDSVITDKIPEITSFIVAETQRQIPNLIPDPLEGSVGGQGIQGEKGEKGDRGEQGIQGIKGLDGKDGKDGKNGKNGKDGKSGVEGKKGIDGKDGSPDVPEEIASKLNTLEEIVDISVIKGLKTQIASLVNSIREARGGGGGDSVQVYDLSSQLNGVLKTFTVPAHRKIVLVSGSSAPFGAFRPTVDFIHTRTAITFDSAIDATISLASGQSLLFIYTR